MVKALDWHGRRPGFNSPSQQWSFFRKMVDEKRDRRVGRGEVRLGKVEKFFFEIKKSSNCTNFFLYRVFLLFVQGNLHCNFYRVYL